jgi:hypothetical protein
MMRKHVQTTIRASDITTIAASALSKVSMSFSCVMGADGYLIL